MANRMPLVGVCALYLVCVGCSSDPDPEVSATAGAGAAGGGGVPALPGDGKAAAGTGAGTTDLGGTAGTGGTDGWGGTLASAGGAGKPTAGGNGGPPPAVNGRSIYALECRGDSKDCNLATVPCLGVSSPTPNVAAGWACANRCNSNADCSDAASGAQAQASCVSFTSAGHCLLVCQNENQSFTCPEGMACYSPPKSPIGYCLWQ